MASSARTAGPPYANAPRRKVRPAEPLAFRVEHSTDRRMNSSTDRRMNLSNEQEPFSLSELAAGTAAVAAVALIAFLGVRVSQPPNPVPADLSQAAPSPAAAPRSSGELSQRRRHVPTATARARQSPQSHDVIMPVSESSDTDAVPSNPPASNLVATTGSPASNFLVEAAPSTIVEMRPADTGGTPPPLIGPLDLFRTKDAIGVQPPKPIGEAAIPAPPEAERNPSNRSD